MSEAPTQRAAGVEAVPRPGTIHFYYTPEDGPERDDILVRSFRGHEEISELYELVIDLFLPLDPPDRAGELRGAEIVGRPARLELVPATAAAGERRVHAGLVRRFQVVARDERRALYRAWLVPQLWALSQNRSSRIFQGQSVRDIAATLLGKTYRYAFAASIKPLVRPYCVQHEESDWAFLSRLLAEEGLSTFFELDPDTNVEVLKIAEDPKHFAPLAQYSRGAGVVTRLSQGHNVVEEHIERLALGRELRPGAYTMRDQLYALPLNLDTVEEGHGDTEVYEFVAQPKGQRREERLEQPATGKQESHLARRRLEELRWREQQAHGLGHCQGFSAGHTFLLAPLSPADEPADEPADAPVDEPAHEPADAPAHEPADAPAHEPAGGEADALEPRLQPRPQLLVSVEHNGVQLVHESGSLPTYSYDNRFCCIPADVPFRPARRPRPHVRGLQSGVVVGPDSSGEAKQSEARPGDARKRRPGGDEEIYTDSLGRVKVQLPWDRDGELDEHSSCWIPVMQAWAGCGWGTMFIPRVGQQVVVSFLDGDPDQPIIIGQVYHLENPPPYELPRHKTRSTIKTASSPAGSPSQARGHNEIRFEDQAGGEELYIRAQLDRNDLVQHDYSVIVGHDQSVQVRNACREAIGCSYVQEIGRGVEGEQLVKEVTVLGDQRESITGKVDYYAAGPSVETIDGARVVTVGSLKEEIKGFSKATIHGDYTRVIDNGEARQQVSSGSYTLEVKQGQCQVSAKAPLLLHSDDTIQQTARNVRLKAARQLVVVGDGEVTVSGDKISIRASKELQIGVGANTITISSKGVEVGGTKITSAAIGEHEITGAVVKIN